MAKLTTLQQAQKAYKKGKSVREKQKKRKVVTAERPKEKKRERKPERTTSTQQSRPATSQSKSTYKPKSYSAKKTSAFQPKTFKPSATQVQSRYKSFQASKVAPKASKATSTKKTTPTKGAITKATVSAKPKSKSRFDLPKNYDYKKDLQQAYKKGSQTTTLGTKQKKTTTKVGKTNLESVNALTRSEMSRVEVASRYGKKKGNVLLKGGKRTGQKDIREKVGSKTAESAYKSKAATGVMQGMSKVDIFSNSVGTYNKAAKKAIKKTKESAAYNIGYGVGMAADMGMGGIGSRGASVAEAAGKGASKVASKLGAKQASKKALKEAARETGKLSRKQGAKRFAKNRAGEIVAETPTNVVDAAKMSMDADGNLDKKEFKKWLKINTALTGGVGGAMEGIGAAATRRLGNKTVELIAKREAGTITKEESEKLAKNIQKLSKKSKADVKTLSSDIAEARMAKIDADSAARAKKVAEAEAAKVPKGFQGGRKSRGQGLYTARQKQSAKILDGERRLEARRIAREQPKLDEKGVAMRRAENLEASTKQAKATIEEAKQYPNRATLRKQIDETTELLSNLKAKPENPNVPKADRINQIKSLEDRLTELRRQEGVVWRAEKATEKLSASAPKPLEKIQNAAKATKDAFEKNPTPENRVRAEVAQEAVEKAEAKAAESVPSSAEQRLKELNNKSKSIGLTKYEEQEARELQKELGNLPGEKAEAPKPKSETPGESTPSNPSKETRRLEKKYNKAEKEYTAAQETYERTDKEAGKAYNEWKAAEEAGHTERAKTLRDKYYALRNHKEYLGNEADKLKVKRDEARKAYDDSMDYAHIDDDGKFPTNPEEKIKAVEAKSEADLGETAVMQKPSRMEGDFINAETGGSKAPLLQKFREMFVSNEAALEDIAQKLPDAERKSFLATINEFRRAVKTGRAMVAEQGRKIYSDFGLTKRGAKTAAKRNEFEEYCFLLHELDRKKQGNNFTNKSREEINARLEELRNKYAIANEDGEIIGSEVEMFQKEMRNYFRKLLGREVDAGITSAAEAKKFMEMYPNYVPTYKPSEFEQMLTKRTSEEINVGKGLKAATGGEHDLVPLYNQMQVKTNAVMKRTQLNKVLNMLCKASGTSEKELDGILPWFKDMSGEQKAEALMDAQVFTKQKEGKNIATMYYNGTPVDISIDKEVYDTIRRWSGEDRKLVVLSRILDNRVMGAAASQFKKWITDYNLIFGVKNLKRDLATALFYTTDRVGFVKNLPKGMAISMLPDNMLPKNLKIYKEAYQVYKENGGVISQFIARDSASDAFFDTASKYNPFKWVENFNSSMETIPRMTEFISALDKKAANAAGKNGDYAFEFRKLLKNKEAVSDAMYRAKDVTLNFDRSGWLGAKLNRGFIPFFNPAVQGISKLGRTVITDNVKYGKNFKLAPGETMGAFLKMGVSLTGMMAVPAVVWDKAFGDYINGKVDGYEKQTDYNRYANYLLPIGDGKFVKIPKARELATLQAPIDFVYDNMQFGSGNKWERLFSDGSERDLMSMAQIAVEQTGPLTPWSDSLFMPIYNTAKNKTWYGGKIESGADDIAHREAGEYSKIWDEKTSATAKWIGGKFNISPKKVDNVLDSYLGVIYDMGISQTAAKNDFRQVAKEEGKLKGLAQLTRTPWGNAFIIDSVFSNANKSDYFDYADKREEKLAKMKEGSDEYIKTKAEITKDKTSFSYTSTSYDELQAQIWLSKDLTMSQKKKYARLLKQGDNLLWNERKDGKKVPSKDPLSVIWNMRDGNGKRIMSTKTMLESCSFTTKNGSNTIMDAYTTYDKLGGKSASKFMEVTLAARDVQRAAGDSLSMPRWETVAYTNQLNHIKGSDKVLASYIEDDKKRESLKANAKIYEDYGGDKKAYYGMKRTITQGAYNLGYDYPTEMRDGELTMILATHRTKAGKKYRDLEYQPNGTYILDNRMNAGRCLDKRLKSKYNQKELKGFCDKYKLNPSDGKNWTDDDLKKVCKAIEKEYKNEDKELWAAKFIVITGKPWKNPYGDIGDYSLDSDTGVYCSDAWKPWGRRRRRGHRRHGWGHGGGGGGGAAFNPEVNKAGGAAKQKITATKVTDTTAKVKAKKSNLNDAYRKKVKKLREETRSIK